eukprot:COSAG01_NODE_747_length_13858_cov_8.394869_12_plen_264_part_00
MLVMGLMSMMCATAATRSCPVQLSATESGWVAVPDSTAKAWWWLWPASTTSNNHAADEAGPLLLWLIGGPGGSGARDAVYQGGPCRLDASGALVPSPHPIAGAVPGGGLSVLYLDEWEWAGYSGGGAPASQSANATAERIYGVLGSWLKEREAVRAGRGSAGIPRDLYIMGYSAAGQYLPVVAAKVLQGGLGAFVKLRGIALGNGLIDPPAQIPTWGPYLYENGLINASVRRPLRALRRPVLTEIYLCNVCSCQGILRRNGRG